MQFWSQKTLPNFALLCLTLGLVACGGGSGTTRNSSEDNNTQPTKPVSTLRLSTHMPLFIQHGILEIHVVGDSKPIYSNNDYTIGTDDFQTTIDNLAVSDYRNRVIWVKLSGNNQTRMYDPILNQEVPFQGSLNAIAVIQDNMLIQLNPASEAIFQRSLVRAGNFDLSAPDISLVQAKHITKATAEVNASLNQAFNSTAFPDLSNSQSISLLEYSDGKSKSYINTFVGLGMMQLWLDRFPDAKNTYLELAQNLAIDMRDGYLDGRSIVGDNTQFKTLVNAPRNEDPEKNTLLDIGVLQEQTRVDFGDALKQATLDYARNKAYQQVRNPKGLTTLNQYGYYTQEHLTNSTGRFRWNGAGDYRPAFGITTTATCQNMSIHPCKQGLNADDIATSYSDIEYLIGTHKVGSCTVKLFPSGDVQLIQNNTIYTGQINRDITDNLLQLDKASKHYLLNIGAGEVKPPHFMQLEIQDAQVIAAKTGYADDFYPVTLKTTEVNCS